MALDWQAREGRSSGRSVAWQSSTELLWRFSQPQGQKPVKYPVQVCALSFSVCPSQSEGYHWAVPGLRCCGKRVVAAVQPAATSQRGLPGWDVGGQHPRFSGIWGAGQGLGLSGLWRENQFLSIHHAKGVKAGDHFILIYAWCISVHLCKGIFWENNACGKKPARGAARGKVTEALWFPGMNILSRQIHVNFTCYL